MFLKIGSTFYLECTYWRYADANWITTQKSQQYSSTLGNENGPMSLTVCNCSAEHCRWQRAFRLTWDASWKTPRIPKHKGEKSKHHWPHTYRKASVPITDATYWAGCEAAGSLKHCRWECGFPHAECRNPSRWECRCSTASLEDWPAGSYNTGRAPPL